MIFVSECYDSSVMSVYEDTLTSGMPYGIIHVWFVRPY